MKASLAILILALLIVGLLPVEVAAQTTGLKFPMYIINPVTGEALTGAWVYASAWEARPPVKVGGSATEQGNGFYYFVLGSCDSCVTSDYYDLWVNNTLDSTRAGIPIGPGGLVLSCDMINTCHIIDDEVLLNEDMENDYGTDSTQTGNIFLIDYETKHDAATAAAPIAITVVDHGTGATQSMLAGLDIVHIVTGKDDSKNSPRGVAVSVVSDPLYPTEAADEAKSGPIGYHSRLRCAGSGSGFYAYVLRGDEYYGIPDRPNTLGAFNCMVECDSMGSWWQNSGSEAGCLFGDVYARRVRNAFGIRITTDTDSSVTNTTGAELTVGGGYPGYTINGYGTVVYVAASEYSFGHTVEAWGLGTNARTTGIFIHAMQDTAEFGQGDVVKGVDALASRAAWGSATKGQKLAYGGMFRAGADTAYGIQAMAQSDEDNANNKAYGAYGSAAGAPTCYGVYGEATFTNPSATHYGVYGKASGGATNYAGYFDGPVYMSAGMQVEDLTIGTLTMDDVGSDAVIGLTTITSGSDSIRVTADDATSSGACAIFAFPHGRQPDQGDSLYVSHITGGAFTIYAGWQTANQGYFWVLFKR